MSCVGWHKTNTPSPKFVQKDVNILVLTCLLLKGSHAGMVGGSTAAASMYRVACDALCSVSKKSSLSNDLKISLKTLFIYICSMQTIDFDICVLGGTTLCTKLHSSHSGHKWLF
jgi:hypothetical protein